MQLFLLEERRDRKVDYYARVLQKAFQKHFNEAKIIRQKEQACDIFYNKKQRRQHSLNRNFHQVWSINYLFSELLKPTKLTNRLEQGAQ